jgi:hypothetical protein
MKKFSTKLDVSSTRSFPLSAPAVREKPWSDFFERTGAAIIEQ